MKIVFSAHDKPQDWFRSIAGNFGGAVKNNMFQIPPETGQGFLKQVYFFEGLTFTYLNFKLYEPLEFIRTSKPEAQLIPIMFFSQEIPFEQDLDEQKKFIGYHTSNGIFMPSPQIRSNWLVPAGYWGHQITLTVSKNWILQALNDHEDFYLFKLLSSGKAFYLFEALTPNMYRVIERMHDIINSDDELQRMKLHQHSMELLGLFFEKLEQRNSAWMNSNLNSSDIEEIFKVRKQLLENINSEPSLKELALSAGMCVSKLQKCFQQVFGKSIFQYALSEKMQVGKQLLDTKRYSVSEVGYKLGYSNLSHFSKIFKKEFGLNPKEYLKSK